MKKQTRLPIALTLAALLFTLLSISSCTKTQGCMETSATNYDANAEEDDGSCTFEGKKVFGWQEDFYNEAVAQGVVTITIQINGDIHFLPITSTTFSNNPSCSETAAFVFTKNLGAQSSETASFIIHALDDVGDDVGTPVNSTTELIGGACNAYIIEADQFQW